MFRRTGSFTAHDDRGRTYEIDVYEDFIRGEGFEGETRLRTRGGRRVKRTGKGEYRLFVDGMDEAGLRLRSNDPNAP
jgi:hypothetical protein